MRVAAAEERLELERAGVVDVLEDVEVGEIGAHAASIQAESISPVRPVSPALERAGSPTLVQGLNRTRLCTFASAYFFPVLPKPPSPRSLLSNSSTTWNPTCITGTMTSCARRSIGFSTKGVLPRFQVDTISCP